MRVKRISILCSMLVPLMVPMPLNATPSGKLDELLAQSNTIEAEKARAILDLDVIKHFNLEEEHTTKLQRRIFKRTKEYKGILTQLRRIRAQFIKKMFHICPEDAEVLDYNIKKKALPIVLDVAAEGRKLPGGTLMPNVPPRKCIDGFCFSSLPMKDIQDGIDNPVAIDSVLFARVSENDALKIERARKSSDGLKVCLFFKAKQTQRFRMNKWWRGKFRTLRASFPVAQNVVLTLSSGEAILLRRDFR